ncbi:alpha/beta hydrolase [Rubrivirga sp. S365]|uniref:Alpha/beta hydrolase n=1 Tax=Rubrivirga litoralis TaxID=3075598 RepID=A0ABU3BQD0_9BACT|nr:MULTISPECIES: alpha/beta hydrolase [unclassified Rubrivirga]MDT0631496.1 alpha/beta hydrolase [Rubrivirga sp. F394]MDT7855521.1 alpha/beta hydrolase [Rubrivirga sp. S365]
MKFSPFLLALAVVGAGCGTPSMGSDMGRTDMDRADMPAPPADAEVGPSVAATDPMDITPSGSAPPWGPTIDPQMLAVIERLGAYEQPPFTEMTPFQVRNGKLPAEAVASLLMRTGLPPSSPAVDIGHRILPVSTDDGVLVRTYTPLDAGPGPLPVVVYYHGGGWVIADLDTYEPSARALAEKAGAIVVSVAYRQAPDVVYPAFHEDSYAAYDWVTKNAAELGGDPDRIATAGESAGGNLSVAVALMAQERGGRVPDAVVSVYPIADGDVESESYERYANAVPLSRGFMEWFFDYATPDWRTQDYEYVDLTARDYSGFPPTTVINAEIDPLQSEGGELADRMRAAGVDVVREVYPGVTHEFFGMAAVLEQAVNAQALAVDRLKEAFGTM